MDHDVTESHGRHTAKDALRQKIWATLKAQRATHRDPVGHIPHFVGAEAAAAKLATASAHTQFPRPTGLDWEALQPKQIRSILALQQSKTTAKGPSRLPQPPQDE